MCKNKRRLVRLSLDGEGSIPRKTDFSDSHPLTSSKNYYSPEDFIKEETFHKSLWFEDRILIIVSSYKETSQLFLSYTLLIVITDHCIRLLG